MKLCVKQQSAFTFLRFILVIIHQHVQDQRKIKIEPQQIHIDSIRCGSILTLVQFLFSFVSYSLSYINVNKEQRKIKIECILCLL